MAGKKLSKKSKRTVSRSVAQRSRAKVRRPRRTVSHSRTVRRQKGSLRGSQAAVPASVEEEARARLDSLRRRLSDLHDDLLLTDVTREAEQIDTTLSLLPAEVEELRARGYVFCNFLERKIEVLREQWNEIGVRVYDEIDGYADHLAVEAEEVEETLYRAVDGDSAYIAGAERAVDALESKIEAAREAVEASYDTLQRNVNQTAAQVREIRWTLDQIDEADFQLYPDEDPILACKAQYLESGKKGPQGILYLTDGRLIFEQKEEIATKKFLFITTDKKTVQKLLFAVPIGRVEEVKAEDKGRFLGRKEMLELLFSPEADISGATLRLLDARNEDWVGLIGRVKSGEIDKERVAPKSEEAREAVRSAPTRCPSCGAILSVEVVRGMREITCEYCGTVIRL